MNPPASTEDGAAAAIDVPAMISPVNGSISSNSVEDLTLQCDDFCVVGKNRGHATFCVEMCPPG